MGLGGRWCFSSYLSAVSFRVERPSFCREGAELGIDPFFSSPSFPAMLLVYFKAGKVVVIQGSKALCMRPSQLLAEFAPHSVGVTG